MATIPALVLSRDEVRLLLRLLGAQRDNYMFTREQYTDFSIAVDWEPVQGLIETLQDVARQED